MKLAGIPPLFRDVLKSFLGITTADELSETRLAAQSYHYHE